MGKEGGGGGRAWAVAKTALGELGEHLRTIGPRGVGWREVARGDRLVCGEGGYIECSIKLF